MDIPEFHGNPNDLDFNPDYVFMIKQKLSDAQEKIKKLDLECESFKVESNKAELDGEIGKVIKDKLMTEIKTEKSIVFVGNEPSFKVIAHLLSKHKHIKIDLVNTGEKCYKTMLSGEHDLLLIDMQHLTRSAGLGLLEVLKRHGLLKETHTIIVASVSCGKFILEKYEKYTKQDNIFKLPFDIRKLITKIVEKLN